MTSSFSSAEIYDNSQPVFDHGRGNQVLGVWCEMEENPREPEQDLHPGWHVGSENKV